MSTKELSNTLNKLLTRNYDAEKGFKEVSEKVKDRDLRTFFLNSSSERNRFGHEIKEIEQAYGIKPDKGSSFIADAHRSWIKLKDILSGDSHEAIIDEAIRGEDYAIDDYEEALNSVDLEPKYKRVLSDHLRSLMSSKEQLDKLKASL